MLEIKYRHEILRKLIHLSSLWMPITIYLLPSNQAIILFSIIFFLIFTSEILRNYSKQFKLVYNYFFGKILREFENKDNLTFTGAFYVCLAVLIALLLFTKIITISAISVMLISDTASALIGRKFGKTKILSKSLEGLLAFWAFGFITIYFIYFLTNQNINFLLAGFLGVIASGITELISKDILKLDDNLTIVLSFGITFQLFK